MIDKARSFLRVVARTPQGRIGERICFVHVPKCGGSALRQALSDGYGLRGRLPGRRVYISPSQAKRTAQLGGDSRRVADRILVGYALLDPQVRYLSGHFEYPHGAAEGVNREAGEPWTFVTVLREPVAKWFSQYFYNRDKESDHSRVELPLERFLETDTARDYGADYVRFFGRDKEADPHDPAAQASAAETLAGFDVVGLLEHMPRFLADFEARYGVPLDVPVRNRNPVSKGRQRDEVTDEIRAEVERLCAPNRAVYRRVRERLGVADGAPAAATERRPGAVAS